MAEKGRRGIAPCSFITANLRAKAQRINYLYNVNRLVKIDYPTFPANNVVYEYGPATLQGDTNGNRAGRITKITSQAGTEERSYGKLGEVTKETKTIASATQGASINSPEIYTTTYQYDTFGRLQRLTYPDAEVLTYSYDAGGNLTTAQGVKNNYTYDYLKRLEYDHFEQRVFIDAGNNVRTRYAYDDKTRRLCGLTTAKGSLAPQCVATFNTPLPIQNGIQNLLYAYDKVGNILNLANSIPVPPPSQYGGPTNQAFNYDDLYRLTHANGRFSFNPDKTRTYKLDLVYDSSNSSRTSGFTSSLGISFLLYFGISAPWVSMMCLAHRGTDRSCRPSLTRSNTKSMDQT